VELKPMPVTSLLIDKYALEARKQLVLFGRLSTAIMQKGFKVSTHLDYSECHAEDGLWA
jgi:hypothetical protein